MRFLDVEPDHIERFPQVGTAHPAAHLFEKRHIDAVNAAIGAGRPLLVRGEPGIGKSQLARAVAKALGRAYLSFVTDARTEARDLLWSFDAVARLADAQAIAAPRSTRERTLSVEKYLHPGVLWWAFNWTGAERQANQAKVPPPPQPDGGQFENGCVVLIDEIDKADSDVPNGLLEAFGAGQFSVRDQIEPVKIIGLPPLVIITTNTERALPDAFIRRCLVLSLSLTTEVQKAQARFYEIGKAHFGESEISDSLLKAAAKLVAEERKTADEQQRFPLPGQAEYIDLLRSVIAVAAGDVSRQDDLLNTNAEFMLAKTVTADRAV